MTDDPLCCCCCFLLLLLEIGIVKGLQLLQHWLHQRVTIKMEEGGAFVLKQWIKGFDGQLRDKGEEYAFLLSPGAGGCHFVHTIAAR